MLKHIVDEVFSFKQSRVIYYKEAVELVVYSNAYAKIRYDARYVPL
jgi:hypothetical protein